MRINRVEESFKKSVAKLNENDADSVQDGIAGDIAKLLSRGGSSGDWARVTDIRNNGRGQIIGKVEILMGGDVQTTYRLDIQVEVN